MRKLFAFAALGALFIIWGCDSSKEKEPWSLDHLTVFGSAPVFSPDGLKIAFGGDDGDTTGLWIYTLGQGLALIWGGYTNYDYAWSPAGDQIAFSAAGGEAPKLYVTSLLGDTIAISNNGRYPDWSPDGLTIVYQDGTGSGLYTVSALGGVPTPLDSSGFFPKFAPDGHKIAYCKDVGVYTKIYLYNIYTSSSAYLVLGGPNYDWSPASDRIVYEVFDVSGPIMVKATDIVNPFPEMMWQGGTDPNYSPSGNLIVFRALSGFAEGGLFTLPASGGSAALVAETGYYPSFGDNDETIVFSLESSGIWLAVKN